MQRSRVRDEFKHRQHRFWSSRPLLLRVATHAMSRCGWIPMPCDTDGGYTLVAVSQLNALYASSMKVFHYQQVNPMNEPIHNIIGGYYSLCDQISKACKDHRIGWRLKSSMLPIKSLQSLSSPIALQCKTHKQAGEVSFRVVHLCHAYPFQCWQDGSMKTCVLQC